MVSTGIRRRSNRWHRLRMGGARDFANFGVGAKAARLAAHRVGKMEERALFTTIPR
jgi:hypothetical protein